MAKAVEIPEFQIVQQHAEVPEIQTSESLKSTHVRQVAPTETVEKAEMNVAMLTTGIEKRADVRLSAMASAIVSSPTCRSLRKRSAHQVSAATVCTTTDIDINKHAGELSTDEVNKNETVLNNSCQFKIPAHMLN